MQLLHATAGPEMQASTARFAQRSHYSEPPSHHRHLCPCPRIMCSASMHAGSSTTRPVSRRRQACHWPFSCPPQNMRVHGAVPAAAASSMQHSGHTSPELQLDVAIRKAQAPAELRAAACLRAYAFYTYPAGRSEFTTRSHRRMKADTEWEALTNKVAGKDVAYKDVRVECWIAAILDDAEHPVAQQTVQDMELSAKLPADPQRGQPLPSLVVATLDVNIGRNLPAEELQGKLPAGGEGDPATQRAYLSNVCVASAARRRGLAAQLIQAALAGAREQGVAHMYVHVVHDNEAALKLYKQAGFSQEAEEGEAFARAAGRPRRLLLHRALMA